MRKISSILNDLIDKDILFHRELRRQLFIEFGRDYVKKLDDVFVASKGLNQDVYLDYSYLVKDINMQFVVPEDLNSVSIYLNDNSTIVTYDDYLYKIDVGSTSNTLIVDPIKYKPTISYNRNYYFKEPLNSILYNDISWWTLYGNFIMYFAKRDFKKTFNNCYIKLGTNRLYPFIFVPKIIEDLLKYDNNCKRRKE